MVLINIFAYLKSTSHYSVNEIITTLSLCMDYQIVLCSVIIEIRELLYPLCMSIYKFVNPMYLLIYICVFSTR